MEEENISKMKRIETIKKLEEIKDHLDEVELKANINEIEKMIDENKYGLVFEKHVEEVYKKLEDSIPVFCNDKDRELINNAEQPLNFILEGDNLHSLFLLSKIYKHGIDMIYIDPPYNTGSKDWKYNNNYVDSKDGYRHSKWLSMMQERLLLAKKILKRDGVLVCAIDENELATVTLLLEDLFGYDYKIDTICIVHNPRGVQGDNFSYTNEYALFVYRKGSCAIENKEIPAEEIDWRDLRDNGHESLRSDAATCFYAINIKDDKIIGFGPNRTHDLDFHPKRNEINEDGSISIYPVDKNGIERKWRYNTESVENIKHLLRIKQTNGVYDIELGKNFGTYKTVWTDKKFDSNEYGTKMINDMVPSNDFDFPKSLYNTYECLYAVLKNKPNAIVLDYFAGSGTTGHAVLLMNKLIGGNRKFILCTNNDVGEKKEKEFLKKYENLCINKEIPIESPEFKMWQEQYGIASSITYPRIKAAINGYKSTNGTKTIVYEKKLTTSILLNSEKMKAIAKEIDEIKSKDEYDKYKVSFEDDCIRIYGQNEKDSQVEGLGGNIMYYKTDFINKYDQEFDISDVLLNSIKEMIYIREGQKCDKRIIFSEEDYDFLLDNISDYANTNIYISPYILINEQDNTIFKENNINIIKIPEIFYEEELREVGEI